MILMTAITIRLHSFFIFWLNSQIATYKTSTNIAALVVVVVAAAAAVVVVVVVVNRHYFQLSHILFKSVLFIANTTQAHDLHVD
jgi:hypothetical protein